MSGIVEHVGRAICAAQEEDYMEFHREFDRDARAAIKATLGYLKDNVSVGMEAAAFAQLHDIAFPEHGAEAVRAALTIALTEIEGV